MGGGGGGWGLCCRWWLLALEGITPGRWRMCFAIPSPPCRWRRKGGRRIGAARLTQWAWVRAHNPKVLGSIPPPASPAGGGEGLARGLGGGGSLPVWYGMGAKHPYH